MSHSSIVVVGSSNTDMVTRADHLPGPGETILGGQFFMNPGGKGANQAVAAARLGGTVIFIARIGDDVFGRQSLQLFGHEGIDTGHIIRDPENPSGVALITVDKRGENCIVVAPGSNAALTPADIDKIGDIIRQAAIVLLQLEIPISTVEKLIDIAASAHVPVILNPAPACLLADKILSRVSIITPNEKEAALLTGIPVGDSVSAERAARKLKEKGIRTVIITLGAQGALLLDDELLVIPAPAVNAIDTTAAGDVFNGALAVALSEGIPIAGAVRFACRAAAISVTRLGAQSSAPYRNETDLKMDPS